MGSKNRITLLKRSRIKNNSRIKNKAKQNKPITTVTTWGQTKLNYYGETNAASAITILLPIILVYLFVTNLSGSSGDDPNNEIVVKLLVSCDTTKNQYSSFMWEQILRN